jgi:hypothetical protein
MKFELETSSRTGKTWAGVLRIRVTKYENLVNFPIINDYHSIVGLENFKNRKEDMVCTILTYFVIQYFLLLSIDNYSALALIS